MYIKVFKVFLAVAVGLNFLHKFEVFPTDFNTSEQQNFGTIKLIKLLLEFMKNRTKPS